jgi:hypothetical protein
VFVENLDSIKEFDGLKPHPSTMAWYSINNQDIIEQSGANPYAMGGGGSPNFASEVVAVNGNSGLTAGIIIKDHTLLVSRVARKLIAMGKINDNASFSIEIDGTKQMFGPANPPEQYLEPYTKIEVSEDTHAFMPRDARIQEARENLMLFMKLASVAPQMFGVGVLEATRRYLRAMGITNIKPWMTNAGGQGGAAAAALPSMMDPAMQAGNGLDPADEGRLGVRQNGQTPTSKKEPVKTTKGIQAKASRDKGK